MMDYLSLSTAAFINFAAITALIFKVSFLKGLGLEDLSTYKHMLQALSIS